MSRVVTCHACCRTETIRHFLAPPIRGVVLQCYGAGNMPSNREDIIQALTQAADNGAIIVSCTQVEKKIIKDVLYKISCFSVQSRSRVWYL